jgi:hypothetical protein
VNALLTRIHEEFFGGKQLKEEIVLYRFDPSKMEPEPQRLGLEDREEDLEGENWFVYARQ